MRRGGVLWGTWMIVNVIATVAGVILILVALRDVVHELFHPVRTGSISRAVMRASWSVFRKLARRRHGALRHAGPTILILVAASWTALLVVGWALIYWRRLPGEFHPATGLPASATRGFATALYVSLATLPSLGASDLTPRAELLRLVSAMEGVVGLVLITAWITWVLSIYPVLADRRAFAQELALYRRTHPPPHDLVADQPLAAVTETLRSFAEQTLQTSAKLRQSRVTYYFQNDTDESTLTLQLPYALELARAAEARGGAPAVRDHGRLFRAALESLLADIGAQYLGMPDAEPDDIVRALARDRLLALPDRTTGSAGSVSGSTGGSR
jgi:hypothetical protein